MTTLDNFENIMTPEPLPPMTPTPPAWRATVRQAFSSAAAVSAIFCLAVGSLLIGNHAWLVKTDPLNAPALVELRRQFADAPNNETLKHGIRAADLRARQVYFRHGERIATGTWLLLCGALVLLVSLAAIPLLRDDTPDVSGPGPPPAEWERRRAMRRGLAVGFVILIAAALLAVWLAGPNRARDLKGGVVDSKQWEN